MNTLLPKIHYTKPSITELEVRYATDAAANGWGEHCYDYIHRFEGMFTEYIGSRHGAATSSATGALHLGLAALGIGPGDEVILADTNWIASVAPVVHLGATPVFVDILPDTWCLDPDKVEGAITPKTKAIIAVHLYGNLCDMDRLEAIAAKHKLFLIEDAAEALGSRWGSRYAGSRGIFGFFSFHGTKTMTTGEGGMFVTNDAELYEKVLTLNNHGRARGETRQFWASVVGYKYKISNIQAAIGCAQMERVQELIRRKREIFFTYCDALCANASVRMNPTPEGDVVYGYWMPTVIFSEASTRDAVLEVFQKNSIDGRVFFHPLSSLSMFTQPATNVLSYSIAPRALNLPSYYDMTANDLERVIAIIKETAHIE